MFINRRKVFMTAIVAAVAAIALVTQIGASSSDRGDAIAASQNCTIVGTWFGVDGTYTWVNTTTYGSSATVGQLNYEWVKYDPTLGGLFPGTVRWTNSIGVWEKVKRHEYRFTWVCYGLDAAGAITFIGRASGTKSMTNCDHVNIAAVIECWVGEKDINTVPPDFSFPAGDPTQPPTETRMPLVQAVH